MIRDDDFYRKLESPRDGTDCVTDKTLCMTQTEFNCRLAQKQLINYTYKDLFN